MPVFRRLVRAGHHYNKLSPRIVHGEVRNYFVHPSADGHFKPFREIALYGQATLRAEHFGELIERLAESVRRLVEDHRATLLAQCLQACPPTLLGRQEPLEAEAIRRQTRHY